MVEGASGAGATGPNDINNLGNSANGSGPVNNANAQRNNGLDLSKIGDEEFGKIFDDPRVFKHDRFKNLLERAKAGDAAIEARKKAEEQKLIETKKFEELAKLREQERDEFKNKYNSVLVDSQIRDGALKLGVSQANVNALLKLVDRSKVTLNDEGIASGIEEAVKATLELYPVFKGTGGTTTTLGGGTNPPGGRTGTVKRFKLSQIQDPKFYRENEKDIQEAYKAGAIEDDVNK